MKIKKNQAYKNNVANFYVIISGLKKDKFQAKVLTDKQGVYGGTHTLSRHTLDKRFTLI